MPLISEKLPTDIGLIIARKFKSEVWYLNEITEVLKQIEAKNKTKQNKNKKKTDTFLVCTSFNKSSLALYSNRKPFRKIAKQRFDFSGSKHSSNKCLLISEILTHKKNN